MFPTPQSPRREEVREVGWRGEWRHPDRHAAPVFLVSREDRVEPTCSTGRRETHHDARVPPGVAVMHNPSDVAVLMDLNARDHSLGGKGFAVVSFHEFDGLRSRHRTALWRPALLTVR